MRQLFLGKNFANTKPNSFAIYAIPIFDEGKNHFFPVLL